MALFLRVVALGDPMIHNLIYLLPKLPMKNFIQYTPSQPESNNTDERQVHFLHRWFSKVTTYWGFTRWWFQIVFVVTPTWENDKIWRSYFSNGLKPPTSYIVHTYYTRNKDQQKLDLPSLLTVQPWTCSSNSWFFTIKNAGFFQPAMLVHREL